MKNYIYNPSANGSCIERIPHDDVADTIRANWEVFTPGDDDPGFCGNYNSRARFVDGKFVHLDNTELPGFYSVMSSADWLYRIVAVFDAPAVQLLGRGAYKSIWGVALRHRKLDLQVTIYDYKGSASLGARTSTCATGNKFKLVQHRAVLALLNGLVSPQLTHPYDGTVAGTVA